MFGLEAGLEYFWAGLASLGLGYIGWNIKNVRKEQSEFQKEETKERVLLEKKVENEYLEEEKHTLLCENAGLKLANNITKHFDDKLKEHENELKKAIKNNGHTA